ncbi:MAG: hypothetical protein WC358_12355 [Ignavibacteria bacterium]|jgi:hypothetical protein
MFIKVFHKIPNKFLQKERKEVLSLIRGEMIVRAIVKITNCFELTIDDSRSKASETMQKVYGDDVLLTSKIWILNEEELINIENLMVEIRNMNKDNAVVVSKLCQIEDLLSKPLSEKEIKLEV